MKTLIRFRWVDDPIFVPVKERHVFLQRRHLIIYEWKRHKISWSISKKGWRVWERDLTKRRTLDIYGEVSIEESGGHWRKRILALYIDSCLLHWSKSKSKSKSKKQEIDASLCFGVAFKQLLRDKKAQCFCVYISVKSSNRIGWFER